MPGGSSQSQGPSIGTQIASEGIADYLFGTNELARTPAGVAGSSPGTLLPNFNDILEMSQGSFFGSLQGEGANPLFTQAANQVLGGGFDPVTVNSGAGAGLGNVQIPDTSEILGPQIISQQQSQQAIEGLLNPPSLFDAASGGPIVDEIRNLANAQASAVEERAMEDLQGALDLATSDLASRGLLSSSEILQTRENITTDVLSDLNVFLSTQNLENTRYLGDLAMQDAINRSNNLQSVLAQAMVEKGINAEVATALAQIASNQAIAQAEIASNEAIAQADINARQQTDFAQNALGLLQLGQQDFQSEIDRMLNTAILPIESALSLATGGPQEASQSSKNL